MEILEIIKVLKIRRYKAGYEVRTELVEGKNLGCEDFVMKSAYTIPEGYYIGNPKMAYYLCKIRGIKPKLHLKNIISADIKEHFPCSIGWCEKEQKWYGWSHRAIYGFGIGSTCKKGDCHYIPDNWEEIKNEGYFGEKCHLLKDEMCQANDIPQECNEQNCIFKVGKGEWTAKTLDDAKQMAIDFAEGIS